MNDTPRRWPVQDAKARFSEFLDTCLHEGPQLVTRRGADAAVLVPLAQWQRMQSSNPPSLKALLLAADARTDELVPRRPRDAATPKRRPPVPLR